MKETVYTFALYENPSDYPGKFVVRVFHNDRPEKEPRCVEDSYLKALTHIPAGATRIPLHKNDDPVIKETFIL